MNYMVGRITFGATYREVGRISDLGFWWKILPFEHLLLNVGFIDTPKNRVVTSNMILAPHIASPSKS